MHGAPVSVRQGTLARLGNASRPIFVTEHLDLAAMLPTSRTVAAVRDYAGELSSVRGIRGAVAFPLGYLDLTLVKFDGRHAREDVYKDFESAIGVKPLD